MTFFHFFDQFVMGKFSWKKTFFLCFFRFPHLYKTTFFLQKKHTNTKTVNANFEKHPRGLRGGEGTLFVPKGDSPFNTLSYIYRNYYTYSSWKVTPIQIENRIRNKIKMSFLFFQNQNLNVHSLSSSASEKQTCWFQIFLWFFFILLAQSKIRSVGLRFW